MSDLYRAEILADEDTAAFIRQFAPLTPRRAAEFESRLITLIDGHCFKREALMIKSAERVTAKKLGARGGKKGGRARARSLTPEQRSEFARKAVNVRWHNETPLRKKITAFLEDFQSRQGRVPSRRAVAKHFNCSVTLAARCLKAAHMGGGRQM